MGNSAICNNTKQSSPRIFVDINNQIKEYEQKSTHLLQTPHRINTIPQPIQNNDHNINIDNNCSLSSEDESTQLIQNFEYVEYNVIDLSTFEEMKEDEEPIAESSLPIPMSLNQHTHSSSHTKKEIHTNNTNTNSYSNIINNNNYNDKLILTYPTLSKAFPNITTTSSQVILYQSSLMKLINLQYRKTKTYTQRYCCVNRDAFIIFNSKESFLRSKVPLGLLPVNEIIKAMKFKLDEHGKRYDHFYISFKRTFLTEKFYSQINKHFFKANENEALIMFKSDDLYNKMHGMCFYQNDGTGRDLYISGNNGGFYKEYRIINTKPPVTSKSIHTKSLYNPVFTKPINRYVCDGQGRDVYIFSQNSRNCKPKSTNSADLEDIVRSDEPDDSAKSNEKSNPTMNSIDCVKNKRNKQIAESVLKRVFYANAENVPVRRMSPKVKFISRSTVITPETSPLNERIRYKDRFQYYYPESRNKCGYVFTQEKLSRDIKSLATFNSRYDK